MVSGAEVLGAALQAKARRHARRLLAEQAESDGDALVLARHTDAIDLGIEAGIGGALLALRDAGLFPGVEG